MAQARPRTLARRCRSAGPRGAARSTRAPKYVYSFASGKAEGSSALRNLLGGKGCELAEMTNLGIPVPPGFTITTEAWAAYNAAGKKHPAGPLDAGPGASRPARGRRGQSRSAIPSRPLLVSVRSGARASMPGHDGHRPQPGPQRRSRSRGWRRGPGNERFAWDCYRRFITMFGDVVLGIEREAFDALLDARQGAGAARRPTPTCPAGDAARARRASSRTWCRRTTGPAVPAGSARAAPPGHQRRVRLLVRQEGGGLPAHPPAPRRLGHRGDRDGDGLRQPRRRPRAPGSASRATRRTRRAALLRRVPGQRPGRGRGGRHPHPGAASTRSSSGCPRSTTSSSRIKDRLERHYRTCRTSSSRSRRARSTSCRRAPASAPAAAAVRIAVEMVQERRHRPAHRAPARGARPRSTSSARRRRSTPRRTSRAIAHGPARHAGGGGGQGRVRPGAGGGVAQREADRSSWCAPETSPEDVAGMHAAQGIAHRRAAASRRTRRWWRAGWGKCCVVGAGDVVGGRGATHLFGAGGAVVREGEVDHAQRRHRRGDHGRPAAGRSRSSRDEFRELLGWADRSARPPACAPTPTRRTTRRKAREFGAEGIGLCRTEHMFFGDDRIPIVREMIMAATTRRRQQGGSTSCCRSSARTSSGSSGRWTACR